MGEDLLKDYTEEQIRTLACDHINQSNEELVTYKIESIDKEYKKHNKEFIFRTIKNALLVLSFALIVLCTDKSVSKFGNDDFDSFIENFKSITGNLPGAETAIAFYATFIDAFQNIIDEIGIFGLILSVKSITLVTSVTKDTIKTLKLKQEIHKLREELMNLQEKRKLN